MNKQIAIRCPNCGNLAQRFLSDCLPTGRKCPAHQITQTECPVCDYFMVMCSQNGAVLEAYAPGIRERPSTATTHRLETASIFLPVPSTMTLAPSKLLTG